MLHAARILEGSLSIVFEVVLMVVQRIKLVQNVVLRLAMKIKLMDDGLIEALMSDRGCEFIGHPFVSLPICFASSA